MSTITRHKKKAEAKAEAKGKQAKIVKSKAKKAAEPKEQKTETKPSIPNYGKCCTCKTYAKFPDGYGHMCKITKKPCARKSTCNKYAYDN